MSLVGIRGKPYVDLSSFIDTSSFPDLDREITVELEVVERLMPDGDQKFQRVVFLPKDHASRKGLLTLVAKRRRLVTYLRNTDPELYKAVLARLGIRR